MLFRGTLEALMLRYDNFTVFNFLFYAGCSFSKDLFYLIFKCEFHCVGWDAGYEIGLRVFKCRLTLCWEYQLGLFEPDNMLLMSVLRELYTSFQWMHRFYVSTLIWSFFVNVLSIKRTNLWSLIRKASRL